MEMGRVIVAKLFVFYVIFFHAEAGKLIRNFDDSGLRIGFYDETCPQAEQIVADTMAQIHETNPRLPAHFLRLFFHDCIVSKSLMISKLNSRKHVPETVSCADTLSFATREAMVLSGLPHQPWPAGRRDSEESLAANVEGNLPLPNWTVDQMIDLFVGKRGLSIEDMVALIGAHSVGGAHCGMFSNRIYNNKGDGLVKPIPNVAFLDELKGLCPDPNNAEQVQKMGDPVVDFDQTTPEKLDHAYYTNLLEGKALLSTDQALTQDERTNVFVHKFSDNQFKFVKKFLRAMLRLGTTQVLTGNQGQIRRICRSVN
ncbi:Peroxidase [Quillaja saponaria]|uniref:Peroxidase n=1 Tax=Quillaja saponaria TaxID=32244 RepID=A0AAD7KQA1_QUISA|nr:Peroxidase [Quillaja saponaria]